MRINLGAIWIIFSLVVLTACAPKIETRPLTTGELAQAQAFAAPLVDNLIATLQSKDYETFSKDFNPTMHDVLALSNFEEMLKIFDERIGVCSTPAYSEGIMMNEIFSLTYTLTCQKDTGVKMQVLFEPDEPHLIAGLFFTSPKLSQ